MKKYVKAWLCPVLILILLTSGCMSRPAPVREVPLAPETTAASEADTQAAVTEPATEAPAESSAEAAGEPAAEKTTEAATEAPTESATEELTEATTEELTEATTEELTEATTEDLAEATAEATAESTGTEMPETPAEIIADESGSESVPDRADAAKDYVINKNTKKFHIPSCSSVSDIKDSNRWDYHGTREEIMEMGYIPCKRCNP